MDTNNATNFAFNLGYTDFYKKYKMSENPFEYDLERQNFRNWLAGWSAARETEIQEEFLTRRKYHG